MNKIIDKIMTKKINKIYNKITEKVIPKKTVESVEKIVSIENKRLKLIKNIMIFLTIIICLSVILSTIYGATTTPTLVNKLNSAFKKIQEYLVKLATPTAGIAIATGVMMRKLSFGDEEKMVKGKKVIVNAIVGYAIIISIDLIIKFVSSVLA